MLFFLILIISSYQILIKDDLACLPGTLLYQLVRSEKQKEFKVLGVIALLLSHGDQLLHSKLSHSYFKKQFTKKKLISAMTPDLFYMQASATDSSGSAHKLSRQYSTSKIRCPQAAESQPQEDLPSKIAGYPLPEPVKTRRSQPPTASAFIQGEIIQTKIL